MVSRSVKIIVSVVALAVAAVFIWQWVAAKQKYESEANQTGISDQSVKDILSLRLENGLIRLPENPQTPADEQPGPAEIHATYLATVILQARSKEIANESTLESLKKYVATSEDNISKMEAYATLHKLGHQREQAEKYAEQQARALPEEISAQDAPSYLALMEPALTISPNLPLRTLKPITAGEDENLQRVAASTIILNYLFKNPQEIRASNPELATKMQTWITSPETPLPQYLISAATLNAAAIPAGEDQQILNKIRSLYGCNGHKSLLPVDPKNPATCSLTLTHMATHIGALYAEK